MIDIVDSLGETRWLMPPEFMAVDQRRYRVFGDGQAKLLPRDQWKPTDLAPYSPGIMNQGNQNSCNAYATVACVEIARGLNGLAQTELSCGYLYGNINRQIDQGSLLEDAIEWMEKNGTPERSVVGNFAWRRSEWPSNAVQRAKQFRVLEWWYCPTFEHMASALVQGYACNIGMMWWQNDNPGSDGFLPGPGQGRGNRGGHAICVAGLAYEGDRWALRLRNSWSERWGVNGQCLVSEARAKAEQGNFGWFAVRNVTVADTDPTVPAVTL